MMSATAASGKYTYEVHADWARLLEGSEFDTLSLAVDSSDKVYCLNRHPEDEILVFERDGRFRVVLRERPVRELAFHMDRQGRFRIGHKQA